MKPKILLIIMLAAFMAALNEAKGAVVLNSTNFPDANFRAYITSLTGVAEGETITDAKIASTTKMSATSKSISSVKGVEYFTNLSELEISSNNISSIDLTPFKRLWALYCFGNKITTLDVSQNTGLGFLNCNGNSLTTLDVSQNTKLINLSCANNKITTLDVSHNTAELLDIYCGGNSLTTLDVSQNTKLQNLECGSTSLTTLDVSHNTELTSLYCSNNSLTTLDVSQNTKLQNLDCANNKITTLDVSHNTELTSLYCSNNSLTTLDVSHNTALKYLGCFSNSLTTLDVSHNTALKYLGCSSNSLTTLDVSNTKSLTQLDCDNNKLITIQLGDNALRYFEFWKNYINSLSINTASPLYTFKYSPNGRIIKVKKAENANHPASSFYYIPVSEIAGKTSVNTGTTLEADGFDVTKCTWGSGATLYTTAENDIDGVPSGTQILKLDANGSSTNNTGYNEFTYVYTTGLANSVEFYLDWKDADVTTHVSDLNDDSLRVYATDGVIHAEGADNVAVYGINGIKIYDGGSGEISVSKGLYIVKADGQSYKVAVK